MGYTHFLFWDSSLLEIYDLMESYNRRKINETKELEEKLKMEISLNAVLSRQIGEYIGSILDKNVQITPLSKLFPNLFKDEEENNVDMNLYKAKMEEFAFRHNQRLKREGE